MSVFDRDEQVLSINELLSLPDKGMSLAGNPLTMMVREMFKQDGITPARLNSLLNEWAKRSFPDNETTRSSAKSNLRKAIIDDCMSWKSFIRVMDMIGTKEVVFTAQRVNRNNVVSHTSVKLGGKVNNGEG